MKISTTFSRLRPAHASWAALLAATTLAQSARADRVELTVQAPYDVETDSWDLNLLDERAPNRLLDQDVTLPYERIEQLVRERLAEELYTRQGTVECSLVIDEACPDVDWQVSFDSEFRFVQRGEPVLTPYGNPTDNGVRVSVDGQAYLKVVAHAEADPGGSVDVPLEVLIGVRTSVALKLYPVLDYQDFEFTLSKDWSSIDIEGLNEIAIKNGAIVGAGIGIISGSNPIVGGLLGGILGAEAADIARDELRRVINQELTAGLAILGNTIEQQSEQLRPVLAEANQLRETLLQHPIPGVGRSFQQLQDSLGFSVDVRSFTDVGAFRTTITPRFANAPASGEIAGELVFPRTFCSYGRVGSSLTGYRIEKRVDEINADLAGASCATWFADQLAARVYYGADPERALASGIASNHLPTWGALGTVTLLDEEALDTGTAFVCRYTVSGLPEAAIVELRPTPHSELDQRLWDGKLSYEGEQDITSLRKRYFLLDSNGFWSQTLAFDHLGTPVSASALALGGIGPTTSDDCPDIEGETDGGLQPELPPEIPNADHCPMCELPQLPGRNEVLPPDGNIVIPSRQLPQLQKLPTLRR